MKYTIDEAGIHYEIETSFDADYPAEKPPIPMIEAVEACHAIRDQIDAALCECEQQGARKCGRVMDSYCCDAMKYAIEENYLYKPMQMVNGQRDGKTFVDIKPLAPAIMGEKLSKRSRKNKPSLVLSFCPWCKADLDHG